MCYVCSVCLPSCQMLARLDVCMGGRVAEELVFGEENVTSGAVSDIQQATRLANAMVTKYGFSEKVGILYVDDKDFKATGQVQNDIDDEVGALLAASYARAKKLLETHRRELDLVAAGLLVYESLSGGEVRRSGTCALALLWSPPPCVFAACL